MTRAISGLNNVFARFLDPMDSVLAVSDSMPMKIIGCRITHVGGIVPSGKHHVIASRRRSVWRPSRNMVSLPYSKGQEDVLRDS